MSKLRDLIKNKKTTEIVDLLSNKETAINADDLQMTLIHGYREIIQPLCAALIRNKISITEDFVFTAIQYLYGDFEPVLEIMKAVVATGNKLSEALLIHSFNKFFMTPHLPELLDMIIKSGGKLTTKSLQAALFKPMPLECIQNICNQLVNAKVLVPEDFIFDALSQLQVTPDLVLQIIGTVFMTGGKVSEEVLIQCFDNSVMKPEIPCILSVIRDSKGELTSKCLVEALLKNLEVTYIKEICKTLIQTDVTVPKNTLDYTKYSKCKELTLTLVNAIVATNKGLTEEELIAEFNLSFMQENGNVTAISKKNFFSTTVTSQHSQDQLPTKHLALQ